MLVREGAEIVFGYFVMAKYTPLVALLTKLLGRKLIIATGGVDSTYVPDIDWGDMASPVRRRLFALVMRVADSVLAFSNSSKNEILHFGNPKRARTAYPAIDSTLFVPPGGTRPARALTVCYSISRGESVQKGIRDFVDAARLVPGVEFVVQGKLQDDVRDDLILRAAPNVRFTDRMLDRNEYVTLLQSASIYVQASAHEGFGVALAEAMACGCVPVVSNRYALPETVGDTGYLVSFGDPVALASAVREALAHPEKGLAARQRVIDNFSVAQRARILQEECEFVLKRTLNASDIDS
ncbi:MAG TPA: glycosyltransferase family 4 protein [Anaerolineae bacterium]